MVVYHSFSRSSITKLTLILLFIFLRSVDCRLPEQDLTVPELIRYWRYPVENHQVKTDDGYYLTLHRIPYGQSKISKNERQNCTKQWKRPVVFLQHGLLCSSSNWVENHPHNSLGFLLADAGFDVWMGNVRGNTYSSSRHSRYPVESMSYWDFSFHEMAKFDLPSMVSYVLNKTAEKKLYYVGHSQGSMMIFAGLPGNQLLQSQIKTVFALAPVSRLKNIYAAIRHLAIVERFIGGIFNVFRQKSFLRSDRHVKSISREICPPGMQRKQLCDIFMRAISGYNKGNFNLTRAPIYFSHTPAGTSFKNMRHFAQLINSQGFHAYDYGWFGNIRRYGTLRPQAYRFDTIQTPMQFIYGSRDWLAAPPDVKWTAEHISNLESIHEVQGYNHLDFLWGKSAKRDVYDLIIDAMNRKENC